MVQSDWRSPMSVETANFPLGFKIMFIGRLPTLVSLPSGGVVILLPVTSWSVICAPTRAAHGMAGNTRLRATIQKPTSTRTFFGLRVWVWLPFFRLLVFWAGFGRLDDQRTFWKAHASPSKASRTQDLVIVLVSSSHSDRDGLPNGDMNLN